jgi:hypothetical protein
MNQRITPLPYLCSELVIIATRHRGRDSQAVGNLEAIGEWTLVVLTQEPLRHGTEISIKTNSHVMNGIVERCKVVAQLGYYLEVRLKPESRWSERWFKPKHLLKVGFREEEGRSPKALTLEKPSVTEYFLRADSASRMQANRDPLQLRLPQRFRYRPPNIENYSRLHLPRRCRLKSASAT